MYVFYPWSDQRCYRLLWLASIIVIIIIIIIIIITSETGKQYYNY